MAGRLWGRPVVLLLFAVVLLVGCTTGPDPADDVEQAVRAAFGATSDAPAIGVTLGIDGLLFATGHDEPEPDSAAEQLIVDGRVEVRSGLGRAAHARVLTTEATTALLVEAAEQLVADGLGPVASSLTGESWVRIAVPTPADAGGDRVAAAIGGAGERFLDSASAITAQGADEVGDRIEVTADRGQLARFADEVLGALLSSGEGADAAMAEALGEDARTRIERDGAVAGTATLEVWIADDQLRALSFEHRPEGGAVATTLVHVEIDLDTELSVLPSDAPVLALRALLADTLAAVDRASRAADAVPTIAAADAEPDGDVAEPAPAAVPVGDEGDGSDDVQGESTARADEQPRTPTGEPAPLREGGVLEEAFGDDNPFRTDAQFECVTDEELEILGLTFGPQVVEEFEELIEGGFLERC